MTAPRRIAVITGTRAEYGLLMPLMRILSLDGAFELKVIATGTHLSERFGMTVNAIIQDGFCVDERVALSLDDDSPLGVVGAIAATETGIAAALERIKPDVVVVLGDRYEILAAATAAFVLGATIAHIHGGEKTEGAMDDSFRHAITKLSHLHFVAAESYRNRVLQLGEQPDRIFNVGALGLDAINQQPLRDRAELMAEFGWPADAPFLLMTYHPVTMDTDAGVAELVELLAALEQFADQRLVVTGHNADMGHRQIGALLREYAAAHPDRVLMRGSLGQRNYLSTMKYASAVVGNSSSGLIEAPAFGLPTVNIGDRQKGRLRGASVIDCCGDKGSIVTALKKALSAGFRETAAQATSPYGTPGASRRIVDVLKTFSLAGARRKSFYDLPVQESMKR